QALEVRRRVQGAEHTATAGTMASLGAHYLKQQRYAEAEPLLRECLKSRERHESNAWRTFSAKSLLGGSLLGQKKYAEAEPLLLAGYEGLKQREDKIALHRNPLDSFRFPADRQPWLKEALRRLVQLYEATGRPDQAAEWRSRLEGFK